MNIEIHSIFFSQFGESFRVYRTVGGPKSDIGIKSYNDNSPFLDRFSRKAVLWSTTETVLHNYGENQELTMVAVFKVGQSTVSVKAQWKLFGNPQDNHLDFSVWVPDDYKGKTTGLLGNYDGDHRNDYIKRNGQQLHDVCNPHDPQSERDIDSYMKSCEFRK